MNEEQPLTPKEVQEAGQKVVAAIAQTRGPVQMHADLDFGDGTYRFRLKMDELEILQKATDSGPMVILDRLSTGTWRVADVSETIRLGLVGGGMKPVEALRMVRMYVHDRPDWLHNVEIARVILMGCIFGFDPNSITKDKPDGEIHEPGPAAGEAGEAAG